jgi:hypothetical protein
MKIMEALRQLTNSILSESSDHMVVARLKDVTLESVIYFNRFNAKNERTDSLRRAIEAMDDVKVMIKIAVELKCIEYDAFKMYEDQAQQLVKMMVSELNITFGSRKAVAERSLGR